MVKEGIDPLFGILNSQFFPYVRSLIIFKCIKSCYKRESGEPIMKKIPWTQSKEILLRH